MLGAAGVSADERIRAVHEVTQAPSTQAAAARLVERVEFPELDAGRAIVERCLLIETALRSLPALPQVPVSDAVKLLICDEVASWSRLDGDRARAFAAGTSRFEAACKTASLRRFPAGEFDWEAGGLPLSYLLRVSPRDLPRAVYTTVARLGGRAPVFFAHLGYGRRRASLSEVEANRSYYRMARSMELQPAVRGFVASSWIRSPDTHRVSPHLAWLNRVFLENGGFVAVMGAADPGCGVFVRSRARRALYERGEFVPTVGLVIWPRRAMIRWAAAHPEFADPECPAPELC